MESSRASNIEGDAWIRLDSCPNGTDGLLVKPSKLILLTSLFDYCHWNENPLDFKDKKNPVALSATK